MDIPIRFMLALAVCALTLSGCGNFVLPAANSPDVAVSHNFWRTHQYIQVDKGIALIGARSNAQRYVATWDPVTDNLTAHIAGSAYRHWQVSGIGRASLCHAFPVGWCFPVSYYTPLGTQYVRYEVLQTQGEFVVRVQ